MSKMYDFFAVKNLPLFITGGMVLSLGYCFYASFKYKLLFVLLLAFLLLLSCFLITKERKTAVLALFISAILGVFYNIAYTNVHIAPIQELYGKEVSVEGVITDFNYTDSSPVLLEGKIGDTKGKAYVYVNNFNGDIGDTVSFTAKVAELEEDQFFSAVSYNYSHGIYATLSPKSEIVITSNDNISPIIKIRRLGLEMSNKIRLIAGEEAGAILSAMACGDRSYISDELRLVLNRSGIGHVISVSGLHVSILVLLISKVFSFLRLGRIPSFLACETLMVSYVIFTGVKVSAIRALIVVSIFLLSGIVKRRHNAANAIAVCVLGMVLYDPMFMGDTSFLLSVSGVFGVGVVGAKVIKEFKIENKVLMGAIITACGYFCTAPVCAIYFDEISLISVPVNMIFLAPCEVALALCMIFVLSFGSPALNILVKIAAFCANFVLDCCKYLENLKFTYLPIRHMGFALAILVSVVLVALCYLILKRVKPAIILGTVLCCAVMLGYKFYALTIAKETFIRFLSDGTEYACVIHKGDKSTIVSSSGGFSEEVLAILARQGITQVDIFVSMDKGPFSYGSYSRFEPRHMLLSDPTYVFEPKIPYTVFYERVEIKLPYAEIRIDHNDCTILLENTEIVFGESLYHTENSMSVFKGITGITVDGSKPEIYLNGCNLCFKVTKDGLQSYPWLI